MKIKKILFFIESLAGGGAEKVLTDLVSNLNPKKYEITVCSLINTGVYNEYLNTICTYKSILPEKTNLSVLGRINYNIKYNLLRKLPASLVYKYMFKEKYDVEIAFIEGFATKVIGHSTNPNSKKIAWVHIDLFDNHWTKTEYKNIDEEIKVYKNFDEIICVAESVKEAFKKRFGITRHVSVKYNPIDRENIISKSKEHLSEISKNSKCRLVTVGRLEHQKGYDRLLEVVSKLKKDNLSFEVWIVGDGSKRMELESYIQNNELEDYIKLCGFQNNPYKYISQADAFVCSSRTEGFSTVVTEALILGKPVIATNCSGMTELLGDNEYGIITNNNTEDLYLGIKRLIEDNQTLEHYKSKSQERSTNFDIAKITEKIEAIL
ncbi:glycosyltransferase [Pseudotamlana agarivorans]|uniref:glycosyltransferase n=1 Tax=Pseudotamlana agarivorans TaxID=481183 RepID=UPI00082FF239|nr:glycosyltransferase [Tamlana agarivorans]